MKTNYHASSRYINKGVPFWVLPLVLFILLTVVLTWTLLVTQHTPSNREFQDIENSINNKNIGIKSQYTSALNQFKIHSYYSSAQEFKALYYKKNIPLQIKQEAGIYYAFSLLLEGVKTKNTRLIEDSRDVFDELIHIIPNTSSYYSRVLLGYARSTRYLGLNYIVGIDAALKQLANLSLSESLKRQIYLELGYYYFSLNNYSESSNYLNRANLYVDSSNFYEALLSREGTELFLIGLLKNNLIPQAVFVSYDSQIKQKLTKSAMRFTNSGNYLFAKNILTTMIHLFPLDASSEDAYFLMGYIAQKEQNYRSALAYYTKVITNGYLDKDPIALFQMGLIYYQLRNSKTSSYYFNILVQKFPYSYYANEAQKWLDYFYPKKAEPVMPMSPPVRIEEPQLGYGFRENREENTTRKTQDYSPINDFNASAGRAPVVTPEKPVVNVNINQNRSIVSDSNNTNTISSSDKNNSVIQSTQPVSKNEPTPTIPPAPQKEESTKKEELPVIKEESKKQEAPAQENNLSEDFKSLDDNFVDRNPKFKPLF